MAVGEVQAEAETVAMRRDSREVNPLIRSRVSHKKAVVDAALIFIEQDPGFGWPADVGVFGKEWNIGGSTTWNQA